MGSTLPIGHMAAPLLIGLYLVDSAYLYLLSALISLLAVGFTLLHPYILKSDAYK